jgi:hypothetical protein
MYHPGDIRIAIEFCPDRKEHHGMCFNSDHCHELNDSRDDLRSIRLPALYLDHSCNQWVIGGIAEAENMILDLRAAIGRLQELKR